jgi:hypothetical protein
MRSVDPPHVVAVRKVKGRKTVEGKCTHSDCPYSVSAPDTPLGNRSVNANATFHQNHPHRTTTRNRGRR